MWIFAPVCSVCSPFTYYIAYMIQVRTFNWQGVRHLASQRQNICVRREAGNCRICWSADAGTDFSVSGKSDVADNGLTGLQCCAYMADGKGPTDDWGYDCVVIPGAAKAGGTLINDSQCGQGVGLATANNAPTMVNKTVCCKSLPFPLMPYLYY